MSKDIASILAGWDHDPDDLQVRIVAGDDGRDKLQMRIDLGLLQMELDGRPDGQRPHGHESFLDYYETLAAQGGSSEDDDPSYVLEPAACSELMREGVQYYHRYVAFFNLEMYDLVARDTTRNLRLFAFVVRHVRRKRDQLQFDQYRPYVTMMRARAFGLQSLARDDYGEALSRIDEGIEGIRAFLQDYEQSEKEIQCPELSFLLSWRRQVEQDRPVGPVERMEQQLERAVALEDFEEAARLRDQIHRLKGVTLQGRQSI